MKDYVKAILACPSVFARWTTILASNVNLHHAIRLRTIRFLIAVTFGHVRPPNLGEADWWNKTRVVHRVERNDILTGSDTSRRGIVFAAW